MFQAFRCLWMKTKVVELHAIRTSGYSRLELLAAALRPVRPRLRPEQCLVSHASCSSDDVLTWRLIHRIPSIVMWRVPKVCLRTFVDERICARVKENMELITEVAPAAGVSKQELIQCS